MYEIPFLFQGRLVEKSTLDAYGNCRLNKIKVFLIL